MTEHIIPHLPPPLQSSSSSSSSSPSIKNSSQWSDLPKRLGTILTLAPLVVAFLYQSPQSSMLFFTVIHYVCALEWMDLVPDYLRSIVQYNGNDDGMDGTTNDEDTSSSIIIAIVVPTITGGNTRTETNFPYTIYFDLNITVRSFSNWSIIRCVIFPSLTVRTRRFILFR